jgi:hypothetical protein
MPRAQSLDRNRFIEVTRRVEHHFDDAFHVTVHGFEAPDIHAEPPCYRGTNLIRVQVLSLDFAAF